MSGIPIPAFGSWATEATYPSGYSVGLPTKVAPVGDLMVPDTKPPAPQFNWILNAIAQDNAAALQALALLPAQNWQPPTTWAGFGPYLVRWNDTAQLWLVAGFSPGGSPTINMLSFDGQGGGGSTFGSTIGSAHPPSGMTVDAAGNVYVAAVAGSAPNTMDTYRSATGAAFTHNSGNVFTGVGDVQLHAVGTNIIFALGVSSGINDSVGAILNGGLGTFTTLGYGAPSWILKGNGTVALAIMRMASGMAITTPDGVTLTQMGLLGQIGATDVPIDAAWNAARGEWAMAVAVGGGPHVAWYVSPTGLVWTATGTVFTNSNVVSSLTAIGSIWVALTQNTGHTGRVIFSFDAATWYPTGAYLYAAFGNFPTIRASPSQLAMAACLPTSDTTDAGTFRFSATVALPDQTFS